MQEGDIIQSSVAKWDWRRKSTATSCQQQDTASAAIVKEKSLNYSRLIWGPLRRALDSGLNIFTTGTRLSSLSSLMPECHDSATTDNVFGCFLQDWMSMNSTDIVVKSLVSCWEEEVVTYPSCRHQGGFLIDTYTDLKVWFAWFCRCNRQKLNKIVISMFSRVYSHMKLRNIVLFASLEESFSIYRGSCSPAKFLQKPRMDKPNQTVGEGEARDIQLVCNPQPRW